LECQDINPRILKYIFYAVIIDDVITKEGTENESNKRVKKKKGPNTKGAGKALKSSRQHAFVLGDGEI